MAPGTREPLAKISVGVPVILCLRPKARLRWMAAVSQLAAAGTFSRTITTTDDPSKPLTTTTDLVQITRAFKISFQFAKRLFLDPKWFILTLRYGIKESTGGAGADVDLLKERLTFKFDVFDFRTNIWPRLRIYTTLQFYKNMYLMAGVDDVINSRPATGVGAVGRDYFVGAQLMFNDEDLKSLLAVGGSALGAVTR